MYISKCQTASATIIITCESCFIYAYHFAKNNFHTIGQFHISSLLYHTFQVDHAHGIKGICAWYKRNDIMINRRIYCFVESHLKQMTTFN